MDSVDLKAVRFQELHALVEDKYEFTKLEKGRIAFFNELLGNKEMMANLELCIPDVVAEARVLARKVIRLGIGLYSSRPGHSPLKTLEFMKLLRT